MLVRKKEAGDCQRDEAARVVVFALFKSLDQQRVQFKSDFCAYWI
jgi:hypothetical protein